MTDPIRKLRKSESDSARRYYRQHCALTGDAAALPRDSHDESGIVNEAGRLARLRKIERAVYGLLSRKATHEETEEIKKRKEDGRIYTAALGLIKENDRADFIAHPRQWLKSRFEHSPHVFGQLWRKCHRDYFTGLRAAFAFFGIDYLPPREEVYPERHEDEV